MFFEGMLFLYTILIYMDVFIAEFFNILLTMLFAPIKINVTSTIFTFTRKITLQVNRLF